MFAPCSSVCLSVCLFVCLMCVSLVFQKIKFSSDSTYNIHHSRETIIDFGLRRSIVEVTIWGSGRSKFLAKKSVLLGLIN